MRVLPPSLNGKLAKLQSHTEMLKVWWARRGFQDVSTCMNVNNASRRSALIKRTRLVSASEFQSDKEMCLSLKMTIMQNLHVEVRSSNSFCPEENSLLNWRSQKKHIHIQMFLHQRDLIVNLLGECYIWTGSELHFFFARLRWGGKGCGERVT